MIKRELGRTGIRISPIGLGAAQLSEGVNTVYPAVEQAEMHAIVKAALDGGVTLFDTAEIYGAGKSEQALAAGLSGAGMKPGDVTVATKWWPQGRTADTIEGTIDERIANLSPFPVDLHQIHEIGRSPSPLEEQVEAMARLVKAGKVRAVGISNFPADQMEAVHKQLAEHGIPLASNQVQISLLHRNIETDGVLETARRLGVTLIASIPLKTGVLTGKFHADRGTVSELTAYRQNMGGISDALLDRTAPLIDAMREIAGAHAASVSQIALAWLINYYGDTVVAIPGASKRRQAEESAAAMKIVLSQSELQRLADISTSISK